MLGLGRDWRRATAGDRFQLETDPNHFLSNALNLDTGSPVFGQGMEKNSLYSMQDLLTYIRT